MNKRAGVVALYGLMAGLATAGVVEAVRPRGGTGLLVDWEAVERIARARLGGEPSATNLASAEKQYNRISRSLRAPLLEMVGALPPGAVLPPFVALDRAGWLEVNIGIIRRAVDPVLEQGRLPNSLLLQIGRTGLNLYIGNLLAFLGRRVLGQFDPQLLGSEPVDTAGLYLVETNVEGWARRAELPGDDLRRWLILHEMTHAWQFAAHPWLRRYMEDALQTVLTGSRAATSPLARAAAFAGVLPAQWRVMTRLQGAMSLIEGYSNLVMNRLGRELLPGFDRLEEAYRERSSGKSLIEVLVWRLTGLELKLQQYRRGEAFCQAVYDRYGLEVLNLAWKGPENLPTLEELGRQDRWFERVTRTTSSSRGR